MDNGSTVKKGEDMTGDGIPSELTQVAKDDMPIAEAGGVKSEDLGELSPLCLTRGNVVRAECRKWRKCVRWLRLCLPRSYLSRNLGVEHLTLRADAA